MTMSGTRRRDPRIGRATSTSAASPSSSPGAVRAAT
jgi:hypothetical protein